MEISQIVPLANAAAACTAAAGIWYGIRAMVRSNDDRGHALTQQREADDKRHEEAMAQQREFAAQQREAEDRRHGGALAQQREVAAQQREALAQQREAEDRRHGEAVAQQREFMAQQREALARHDKRHEEAMAALKELIRRTAAPGSGTGE